MRNNSQKERERGPDCTVCLEREANCTIDGCSHSFCLRCIKRWARTKNNCPLCRERFLRIQCKNKTIQVKPVPERVRSYRPRPSPPQPPAQNLPYFPLMFYPQPNCYFYPTQSPFFFPTMVPNMPALTYPFAGNYSFMQNQ